LVVEQMVEYRLDVQQVMDEVILLLVEILDHLDENQMLLDQMESIENYLFKSKIYYQLFSNITR
jgi:hypothetical protein